MRSRKVAIAYVETKGRDEKPSAANPWDVFSFGAYRVLAGVVAARPQDESRIFSCAEGAVDDMVAQLEAFQPDVLAASCYMWSFGTFVEVASRLRQRFPKLAVVFGGPCAHPAMFGLAPYRAKSRCVDVLVTREGETVLPAILALDEMTPEALLEIPGATVRTPLGFRDAPLGSPSQSLDEMPSPYRMGLSPSDVPGKIELFRGCPLSCSFCSWGLSGDPSRVVSPEWLAEELRVFRRLGIESVLLVDAGINLNGRAFKSLVEAEKEVGLFRDVALACELYPDYVREEHIDFLRHCRIHTAGVGLQTISAETHKLMQRKFDEKKFRRGLALIEEVVTPTIDIIFGLPGDTPDTFWRTVDWALAASDKADVFAYHALVLPDALMTRAPDNCQIDFDPLTLKMRSCLGWTEKEIEDTRQRLRDMTRRHGDLWYGIERGSAGRNTESRPAARTPELVSSLPLGAEPVAPAETRASQALREAALASQPSRALDARLHSALARVVQEGSGGRWSLTSAEHVDANIVVQLATNDGPLELTARRAEPGTRCYRVAGGIAWSYRAKSLPREVLVVVDRTIERSTPLASELSNQLALRSRESAATALAR
jgi:radical SAM superfamily enzyme YgiQ (UPF0313 family)